MPELTPAALTERTRSLRLVPDECIEWGVASPGGSVVAMAARGRAGQRDAEATAKVWTEDSLFGAKYTVVSRIVETPWRR